MNSSAIRSRSPVAIPTRTFSASISRQAAVILPPSRIASSSPALLRTIKRWLGTLPHSLEHVLRHLVDILRGVHGDEDAPLLLLVLEGLGLLVVFLQPIPDRLLGVVLALDERPRVLLAALLRRRVVLDVVDLAGRLALPAARKPLDELLVLRLEHDDLVYLLVYLVEHLVERLGLFLVAREAVQDPAIVLFEVGLRHVDDDLVGDELALVAVLLYLLPDLGALIYLLPHEVAGLDVRGAELFLQLRRLSAL